MSISQKLQRYRVPLGFVFGVLFLLLSRPIAAFLYPGIAVALTGLIMRVWAAGHLRKHEALAVNGPYRRTRNPLYLGSFVMGLGFCLSANSLFLAVLFLLLFVIVYLPVMKKEEQELIEAFGERYRDYRSRVPLFLPTIHPFSETAESSSFSWKLVKRNREYNAMIGFILVSAFLAAKVYR